LKAALEKLEVLNSKIVPELKNLNMTLGKEKVALDSELD
jgi:hypothetical protein